MQSEDRADFATLLAQVHSFYRQDLTEFALGVWWNALEPYPLERIRKALGVHARDPKRGSFMPMPSDVVRVIDGTHEDRGLIAWGKVLEAAGRVGAYRSVAFDDPAIHATVIDLGGWSAVCRCEAKELPFLQRRFTDLHGAYVRRGQFDYPRWLIGVSEAENRAAGHAVAPPVLIGDPREAERVMLGGVDAAKVKIHELGAALAPALENHERA